MCVCGFPSPPFHLLIHLKFTTQKFKYQTFTLQHSCTCCWQKLPATLWLEYLPLLLILVLLLLLFILLLILLLLLLLLLSLLILLLLLVIVAVAAAHLIVNSKAASAHQLFTSARQTRSTKVLERTNIFATDASSFFIISFYSFHLFLHFCCSAAVALTYHLTLQTYLIRYMDVAFVFVATVVSTVFNYRLL